MKKHKKGKECKEMKQEQGTLENKKQQMERNKRETFSFGGILIFEIVERAAEKCRREDGREI